MSRVLLIYLLLSSCQKSTTNPVPPVAQEKFNDSAETVVDTLFLHQRIITR